VEVPVVTDKKKSRIDRLDAKKFKASFEREGVEFKEDYKKEFKKYVDEMTDEQYKKCVLTDHMDAFAKSKKTAPANEPEEVSENTDKVFEISLKELQSISMLTHMGESVRLYWDGDNGRVVQGPDRDDDEDFEEIKFNGKDYVVGQKTGRVYEALDQGDVFAGYVGVLKFKMLTI
jgi:2',3'-cyclic-nucleotide 2'-phosphodiesterase (5'-nucleotidase family)